MRRHVLGSQRVEQGTTRGRQGPLIDQEVSDRPAARPCPGAERGDELVAGDHPVLEREQSEEEMAIGGGGHGEAPVHDVVPPKSGLGTAPESGHKGRRRIEVILA